MSKAMYGKSIMKKSGVKKMKPGGPVTPVPGMKKSQAKAEEFYDNNPSVRTYTNEYTGEKIPTGPMTKKEYQNAAQRAADVYNDKPTPMQKGGSKKSKDSMEDAAVKRYPNYLGKGTAYDSAKKDVKSAKKDVKSAVKGAKTVVKTVVKALPSYQAAKGTDDFLEKRYPNYFGKGTMYNKVKKGIKSVFQNGGTVKPVVKKPVVKKPVPKKVVPASSSNMKTFRLMQGYDTKGNKVEKMQKGGVTRPIPGQKKPVTRENKITSAMTNGVKSPNLPPLNSKYVKKPGTGLILKDKSKLQEGTYKPTMQTGGGFPITAKAAARKVAKGKGMMTYKYGTTDAPGTGNNKGDYVKFAKDQKSNPYGGKSLKGSRSRSVMQKGGVKK